jgi:hypothetical protein
VIHIFYPTKGYKQHVSVIMLLIHFVLNKLYTSQQHGLVRLFVKFVALHIV